MMYIISAIISAICGVACGHFFYMASAGDKKSRKIAGICSGIAISILSFMCFIG